MQPQDLTRWNARVSLLYAVGIWTMFGTYAYYQMYVWPRKKDEPQNTNEFAAREEELKDYSTEYDTVKEDKKSKEPVVRSTIVYRENFIPYSTRAIHIQIPYTDTIGYYLEITDRVRAEGSATPVEWQYDL